MNKITKEETNWSPGIPGMFGTPLIDPHTFSSFPSTCVKDNQYILPNPALPEILWWFIVNQGLVVVTVNWQQKLCTGVTKVSQTSLGVADDTFPGQKYKFLPKRSILSNRVNFWAWNEVGRCYLTCALINMKLA